MTPGAEVHLSPEAETALRAVPRAAAPALAQALDRLARSGQSTVSIDQDGPAWTGHLEAGHYRILVAGRTGDPRVVVVDITTAAPDPAERAASLLPLPPSRRRAVGEGLRGLGLDLKYTARALRRTPFFAAVVVMTLALGFGGGAALLDILRTTYAAALPFGDAERLVRIRNINTSPQGGVRRYNVTPSDFHRILEGNRSFSGVVAMGGRSLSLVGDGTPEQVEAIGVSPGWTATLRLPPLLGRTFSPEEETLGSAAGVGLISHALWQRRFGGDSAAVGSLLRHDGGVITIVGVMPPNLHYPYDANVWTPWTFPPDQTTASSLNMVARLSDGITIEMARADGDRLHADREALNLHGSATGFDVATVRNDLIRDEARTVQALTAAVLLLLVLACVNVANLLVARFTTRRAELGVRAALGGRRDQQVRQMLIESMVLGGAGVVAGVALAAWLRQALQVIVPVALRTQLGFTDANTGSGAIFLTVGLGLTCAGGIGVAAAIRASRADAMQLIRQGGRGGLGRSDRRLFDLLVASQVSLSLVLLAGASLLIGRVRALGGTDPGFDLAGVTTMRVTLDHQARYQAAEPRAELARALETRLAAIPGVVAVGITSVNPLCCGDWGAPIEIEGRPLDPGATATLVTHSFVSPGYFGALRIPLLRGEGPNPADRPGAPATVVIDEAFARMAWPGEDPLGKRVRYAREGQPWRTVVGVVQVSENESDLPASWFLPYYQDPMGASAEHMHLMVRAESEVSVEALNAVVRQVDPMLAVYGVASMPELYRDRTAQDRLGAAVSGVFAAFGLILAAFSMYGLLAYSVELRRSELGLRMALGASRRSIVGLVVRQAGARLAFGAVVGLGLALALNGVLRSAIDGLTWLSPLTALGLAGVLAAATAIAAIVPAARATRVDPMQAIQG